MNLKRTNEILFNFVWIRSWSTKSQLISVGEEEEEEEDSF
jgi:hypothetical protein